MAREGGERERERERESLRERHLTRIFPSLFARAFFHSTVHSERPPRLTHVVLFSFLSENPLVCSCSSYTQKIWMRQHRKWLDTERRGPKVGPQCAEPRSLDDRHLLAVKVNTFVDPFRNFFRLTNDNIAKINSFFLARILSCARCRPSAVSPSRAGIPTTSSSPGRAPTPT